MRERSDRMKHIVDKNTKIDFFHTPNTKDIQNKILEIAAICRVFSTSQIARFFTDYSRPNQKALHYIRPLIKDGLLETKEMVVKSPRGIEQHLFRLTKKGRKVMKVDYFPVTFTGKKIKHHLGLTEIYLDMCEVEKPYIFKPELRLNNNEFCPDIFTIWLGRAMYIEAQPSVLTSKRWALKWARYNSYYNKGLYKMEAWNKSGNVRPRIVAVSNQQPTTILNGNQYPVEIVQCIKELSVIIKGEDV